MRCKMKKKIGALGCNFFYVLDLSNVTHHYYHIVYNTHFQTRTVQ